VHTLQETLQAAALALSATGAKKEPAVHDALISLREVSSALFSDISQLAPFGVGNPKPIFLVRRTRIAHTKAFGKEKNHIEVSLACSDTGAVARGFDFFRGAGDFSFEPMQGTEASVLATVERDSFRGGLALRLVDILPA